MVELSSEVLAELESQVGESFYVLDLDRFNRNHDDFLSAFRACYRPSSIAYSYKTNYIPAICRAVDQHGGYAEVVSPLEYDLAIRIGVAPERIIFNGPYKARPALESALLAGSVVNLDNERELREVEEIAALAGGRQLRVGLRCNIAQDGERPSRFGFDVASGALRDAASRLARIEQVRLVGLHSHLSTAGRTAQSFARRTATMLALTEELFASPPESINLGGGFFGRMPDDLRSQFDGPVATYAEYADAVAGTVAGVYGPHGPGPALVVEPGTALVADVLSFVAKVVDVKAVGGRRVAVCAGSVHNIKPTLHGKNLPCAIVAAPGRANSAEEPADETDIVGYTCMEHDVLHAALRARVRPGDYAVFGSVGAYTIVMKPPFIMPAPPIVAYGAETGFEVVRRAEQTSDVFATYRI